MENTDTTNNPKGKYSVMGPTFRISRDLNEVSKQGEYRLVPADHRYQAKDETHEQWDAYLDSVTVARFGDDIEKAVKVMRQWNEVGETWPDSTTTPPAK